jgi:single-stranded DNA-specific DHH superfamily exonuclease
MLSKEQIQEIREHLEKAQNPLFYFDNDADGLCSFLLLRRFIGRGRGVAIKSFPKLDVSYSRKAHELKPDYIFILDKPLVSEEFLNEIHSMGLPIVWIDHHDIPFPEIKAEDMIYYHNTMQSDKPSNEPVTYWCYRITERKEDLWLALAGCIGDGFLPEFSRLAEKEYPDYWKPVKTAFDGLYGTELGKVTRILNFTLKDRTSNVVKMIKFMCSADMPDVIEEERKNGVLGRFRQVNEKLQKLVEKAQDFVSGDRILYFQYGGDLSVSADIANELFYKYPDKIVIVSYVKGTKANVSVRGNVDVREATIKSIEGIEYATGGGHRNATGAQMNVEDLPKFINQFRKFLS